MGKESHLLRGLMRTTLDPGPGRGTGIGGVGFGLWLVVDPGPAGRALTAGLAVLLLLTAWSNYRDMEPKTEKRPGPVALFRDHGAGRF